MPQFMVLICEDEKSREGVSPSEFEESYGRVGKWWGEHEANGFFLPDRGNRLQPSRTAKTVRVDNGSSVVTDGPFAETKESIGGFGLVEAPDMDAALAILKTWPGLPITMEVRPVLAM